MKLHMEFYDFKAIFEICKDLSFVHASVQTTVSHEGYGT